MDNRKRKAEHHAHVPNKLKAERKYVKKFWEANYSYSSKILPRKVCAIEAYSLCCVCYPQLDLSETRFKELTGLVGVRVEKDGHGRIKSYYAEPLTDLSNSFHGTNSGERPLSLQLLNIQGMISKKRNKTEMMGKILQLDQPGKICLVTETHLDKNTHSNSEMLKYIPDYHIVRGDRDREFNLEDIAK